MNTRFLCITLFGLTLALVGCTPAADVQTANIKLTSYAIEGVPQNLAAGKVRFVAQNNATDYIHEIAVFKSDLSLAELPLLPDGAVDEEAEGLQLVGELEDVEQGATKVLTLDLAPGHYFLICNKDDHFAHGMHTEFTIAP